jgi:acetamidase/formamidase
MQTIDREDATVYEFGPSDEPLLTVEQGEAFRIETWDAFEGALFEAGTGSFSVEDAPQLETGPPGFEANPIGGPVYVEGAEPGDVLAVHIEEIRPEKGYTATLDGFGNLDPLKGWEECQGNYAQMVDLKPGSSGTTADGTARLEIDGNERIWDLNPHIGTIATAPARTVQEPLTSQGPWGGNMDVRDVAEGSTVFLSSFNDGGMLYAGDVHASQSDSEYTGIAIETIAEIVLSVDVVDDVSVPGVFRIENSDTIIHVDSEENAGTPARALNNCFIAMIEELVEKHGFGEREAYFHMSINPGITARAYQFVQPGFFTLGVKLNKSVLS